MQRMKIIEILKNLDIFSESIQFNSTQQKLRRRTFVGAFLTTLIFVLTGIYFFYQSYLYFNGQIEPKFRLQTFVSDETEVKLENDIIGFDFFSVLQGKYLNQLQAEYNKTFIVYVATFTYLNRTNSSVIPLNIIKCQNPELVGMNCFDFSQISDYNLVLKDLHKVLSYISLMVYKCQDTDYYKNFIPDNCADEKTIDDLINISPYRLNVKIKISQFNTTKQEMQSQYRSQILVNTANTLQYNDWKIQTHITNVKQGLLIQSEKRYASPLSYQLFTQTFNREQIFQETGITFFNQIIFNLDENVTNFNIQYPIFTEILALCNSVLSLLLFFGIFCRKIAQNFIRRDIFILLLKNIFMGTYLKILDQNGILPTNKQIDQNQASEDYQFNQAQLDDEPNTMPSSKQPKSCQSTFKQNFIFSAKDIQDDFTKENQEITLPKEINDVSKNQSQNFSILKRESQFTHLGLENSQKKLVSSVLNSPKKQKFQLQIKQQNIELTNKLSIIPQKIKKINRLQIEEQKIKQKQNIKSIIERTNNNFNTLNDNTLSDQLQNILFSTNYGELWGGWWGWMIELGGFLRLKSQSPPWHKFNYQMKDSKPSPQDKSAKLILILNFEQCKKKEFLKSKGLKQEVLNQLEKQIDESLDFFTFYKELLFLKKAIMVLLSKEQLAALQVIGIDVDSLNINQENQFTTIKLDEDDEDSNHFLEQFKIMRSKQLQQYYINQFLLRCENRQAMDSLDQRIFSSLLPQPGYQNQLNNLFNI